MSDLDQRVAAALRRVLGPPLALGWWLLGLTVTNLAHVALHLAPLVGFWAFMAFGLVRLPPTWQPLVILPVMVAWFPPAYLAVGWLHQRLSAAAARVFGEV